MAMKCFKVVQKVLEDTYGEIPGDDATRDAKITKALNELSDSYKTLLTTGGPDFRKAVTRFAYVYMYVPAHAHWVHELLEMCPEAAEIFDEERVRIACIGGGPGSDLVGILKYLDARGDDAPKIFCEIVDGCVHWKQTWSDVVYTLELEASLNTDYVIHRVGDPDVWDHPTKFAKADLFTFNYFVSEIANLRAAAWEYVEQVLDLAKPGAFLLFNDNNNSSFYGPFDLACAKTGWETLVSGAGDRRVYDTGERTDDLGRFKTKFGRTSKLTGDVAWRVLRKK